MTMAQPLLPSSRHTVPTQQLDIHSSCSTVPEYSCQIYDPFTDFQQTLKSLLSYFFADGRLDYLKHSFMNKFICFFQRRFPLNFFVKSHLVYFRIDRKESKSNLIYSLDQSPHLNIFVQLPQLHIQRMRHENPMFVLLLPMRQLPLLQIHLHHFDCVEQGCHEEVE